MQLRPSPRTTKKKFRKMSFSLSIHAGTDTPQRKASEKSLKTGRFKDFGEHAVILIFVEPVQLEPDIDVQYLEEKDCYFTIHGPQGQIIFADHRISTMTGYMPRDVLEKSAYQYIHSSDVPIALFAQKEMFASSDGTGLIVYRLKICDSSFIYLQSKGQIRYKDSTKEVRQFICCNILLSAEDGRRELQKFKDKFSPQLTASKMTRKKVEGEPESFPETYTKHSASYKSVSNCNDLNRITSMNPLPASDSANVRLMEIDSEPRTEERYVNSKSLFDLLKTNFSVNNAQGCSSFKSSHVDGFSTTNHKIQIEDCDKIMLSEAFSCNVDDQKDFEPALSFDNLDSPLPVSLSSDDSCSFSFTQRVESDAIRLMSPQVPTESIFLPTEFLHNPNEFIQYETLKEETPVSIPNLPHCSKNNFQGEMFQNVRDYSLSKDMEMVTKDNRIPLNAFQNHKLVDSHSLINPPSSFTSSSSADIGQNFYNNCLSNFLEPLSNYIFDTSYASNCQLPQNENGLINASSIVSETVSQANFDLSFLDHTTKDFPSISDLSDFYENSMELQNDDLNGQCQTKCTKNSACLDGSATLDTSGTSISKNTEGTTSHAADIRRFYTQHVPHLQIRNKSRSQLRGSSSSSDLVSEITNLQTGEHGSYPWNEENFRSPVLEQNFKAKNDIFSNSKKLNYCGTGFSQFQTNPAVNEIDAEVFRSGKTSQSCRNSKSTHAQKGSIVVERAENIF